MPEGILREINQY